MRSHFPSLLSSHFSFFLGEGKSPLRWSLNTIYSLTNSKSVSSSQSFSILCYGFGYPTKCCFRTYLKKSTCLEGVPDPPPGPQTFPSVATQARNVGSISARPLFSVSLQLLRPVALHWNCALTPSFFMHYNRLMRNT